MKQSGEDIYQGRLAGAVGAEEPKNDTLGNCEGNVLRSHQASVDFGHMSELNFVFHCHGNTFYKSGNSFLPSSPNCQHTVFSVLGKGINRNG